MHSRNDPQTPNRPPHQTVGHTHGGLGGRIRPSLCTQIKDLGTIRLKLLSRRAPISASTVPLLEILDILRDARKVPGANVERVIQEMAKRLTELKPAELKKLQRFALDYYNPGTRALLGTLLSRCQNEVLPALKVSLNPTTRFDMGIDPDEWPESRAWNIR